MKVTGLFLSGRDRFDVQFGPGGNHAALCGILPACFMRPIRKFFNPDQKKVLVLMSNTGGGHKASAEAIEAGFKQLYGDKYATSHPHRNFCRRIAASA